MILNLIILVLLAAVVGFCGWEGLWSNAIRFVNVVLSAILASSLWPLLASYLEGELKSWTYHVDFASLILLFAFSMMILRTVTGVISKVKVKFPTVVDRAGGGVLAFLSGWVAISYLLMAMHTAPLAERFLFGDFEWDQSMFLGTAPDRQWLGLLRRLSVGSLGHSAPEGDSDRYMFNRDGEFISMFAGRRARYEKIDTVLAGDEDLKKEAAAKPKDDGVFEGISSQVTSAAYEQLKVGMSLEEVKQLLGEPQKSAGNPAEPTLQFFGADITIYVIINTEKNSVVKFTSEVPN